MPCSVCRSRQYWLFWLADQVPVILVDPPEDDTSPEAVRSGRYFRRKFASGWPKAGPPIVAPAKNFEISVPVSCLPPLSSSSPTVAGGPAAAAGIASTASSTRPRCLVRRRSAALPHRRVRHRDALR